jgi:hypothetical protein
VKPLFIKLRDGAEPVQMSARKYAPPQLKFMRDKIRELEELGLVLFCRPDQCSLTNSYVDNNSSLIGEYLPPLFLHDDFALRHLHIQMLRNDYTEPTRCRHRCGIVGPPRLQGL